MRKLCAALLLALVVCPFTAPFRTFRVGESTAASAAAIAIVAAPSPDHPGSLIAPVSTRFRLPLLVPIAHLIGHRPLTAVAIAPLATARPHPDLDTGPRSSALVVLRI